MGTDGTGLQGFMDDDIPLGYDRKVKGWVAARERHSRASLAF